MSLISLRPAAILDFSPRQPFLAALPKGRLLRFGGTILVFVLALYGFAGGADTANIEDLHDQSVLEWVYYAASLFVFGGTDLGTPLPGGPVLPSIALWIAFYLAPLITTTVVADAMLQLLRARAAHDRSLVDHLVLVGSGDLALAYLDAVQAVDPGRRVLLVEHRAEQPFPVFLVEEASRNLMRVQGNILLDTVLKGLALGRAHRAVVISDDDLLNLECAWAIQGENPALPVAAHVADLSLLRPVNRMARARRGDSGARGPSVFSTHRIAALQLYDEQMSAHFERTGVRDDVVIAGFGRLGQTVLELLLARAEDQVARVLVVGRDATREFRRFAADVDTGGLEIITIDGALDDPGTWESVAGSLGNGEGASLALLAHANVLDNLRAAMMLRVRLPEMRTFVRCFRRTTFTDALAGQLSMEVLALEDMLRDALRDHYEALSIA